MILRHHPDLPEDPRRAIGFWRVPLRPDIVAEYEAVIAGGGRAKLPGGITVQASVDGARVVLAEMRAADLLPNPQDFVDRQWAESERAAVVSFLRAGTRAGSWLGWSTCRCCGKPNGSLDFTDSVYIWPEGFAHYVEAHAVRPPAEFVDHVLARGR